MADLFITLRLCNSFSLWNTKHFSNGHFEKENEIFKVIDDYRAEEVNEGTKSENNKQNTIYT